MTEEEKRMVMQFMGQTYGEVKKQVRRDEASFCANG